MNASVVSRRRGVVLVLSALALAALCMAGPRHAAAESWSEGQAAHDAKNFPEAVKHYQALVAAGVRHEALFYNLGNLQFRLGAYGPAIFNFERALRIDGAMSDARYNLRLARAAVVEERETRDLAAESVSLHSLAGGTAESLLLRGAEVSSANVVSTAFLVLSIAFFVGLIVVRYMARGFAHAAVIVVNVFTGLGLACAALLLAAHMHAAGVSVGIVLPADAPLHTTPAESSASHARAYAGLRVRVLTRDSGWLSIRLASGAEGWIPAAAIGELR